LLLTYCRPEDSFPEESYFQFNLLVGARLKLEKAKLNISRIQFVEKAPSRTNTEYVFEMSTLCTLILNVNIPTCLFNITCF